MDQIHGNGDYLNTFNTLTQQWEEAIDLFSKSYQGIVLAASGGLDSTCLFHVLCHLTKKKKNFFLQIYHMNFGLRGRESDEEEEFLKSISLSHGIDFINEKPDSIPPCDGIQNWARQQRYRAFKKYLNSGWVIATAHHQDDLLENIIFRWMRGHPIKNLEGMAFFHQGFWKPFLTLRKSHLERWMLEQGLPYKTDSSNQNPIYTRNSIRLQLLPLMESIVPAARKNILKEAAQAKIFMSELESLLLSQIQAASSQEGQLPLTLFENREIEIQRLILQLFLKNQAPSLWISHGQLEDLRVFLLRPVLQRGAWHSYPLKDRFMLIKQNGTCEIRKLS